MMTQGELGFKYEAENQGEGMTGMGGIGPYLELACRSGMVKSIERHVKARQGEQGWKDAESVLSLVLLNLVGGDCVEDVDRLQSHYLFRKHFCRVGSGNEKGVVEGVVKFARLNFFVPVPQVRDLDELNDKLAGMCREDLKRRLRGRPGTKAKAFPGHDPG